MVKESVTRLEQALAAAMQQAYGLHSGYEHQQPWRLKQPLEAAAKVKPAAEQPLLAAALHYVAEQIPLLAERCSGFQLKPHKPAPAQQWDILPAMAAPSLQAAGASTCQLLGPLAARAASPCPHLAQSSAQQQQAQPPQPTAHLP